MNALNGNDTLNGLSTSTPWQTIDKINTVTLYPGDRVRFCSGQTFLGMFQPVGNGNIINPIIEIKFVSTSEAWYQISKAAS